ncbi:halogenase [Streptomyces sulfonofaciens]|uniref:Halogenase n=1 Tax=Streptomyces sulfonofaciens TaxID=68272 RepID=A0A919LAG2_9ACTN|nr:FAD-dependent oxidoreductase [Streptomyces sulfonofaciens]GHH88794.1 halogenase [Streptomyces sulfonofaciens]
MGDETSERFDVAILGGGITGLTLARQLKRAEPGLRITVLERQPHPVPEAAHKVGESSQEVQAHYLRDVLGLEEHLAREQLRKFGLRMFFTQAGNEDIARRVEFGQVHEAPLATYQLDRGRLENALGDLLTAEGVAFRQPCKVRAVDLGTDGGDHVVHVLEGDRDETFRARWIVDATGRASLLKRKLGLAEPVGHRSNAAWLRIDHPIDLQQWSDDEQWRSKITGGDRRLSTNHLMGPGYWVWLIPLSSGSTSVGIVAEDASHPFDGFNTRERALDWLDRHEPQCAAEVRRHQDGIQDFRVMKNYAYGCRQVYSGDRWCLTGEAGVSIDPLFSSGGDLMAVGNGLITDLVTRDHRGEDVRELAAVHNEVYLVLSETYLVVYQNQYPLMGNAQIMVAKVVWDTLTYWSGPGLLFFHDTFPSLTRRPGIFANLQRAGALHARVQQLLREWHSVVGNEPAADVFVDPLDLLDFMSDLQTGMAAGLGEDELDEQFARNVVLLEQIAGQLVTTVIDQLERRGADDAVKALIDRWRGDPLLCEAVDRFEERQPHHPVDGAWITLGARPVEAAP